VTDVEVLVIRHGQSEWNAAGRWQGHADPPLTGIGIAEARLAAANIDTDIELVASSDLERANHTARLIAAKLDLEPVTVLPALRERHAGPFEGLTRAEINENFPGAIERRDWPEGFEGDDELIARVIPAMHDIAGRLTRRGLVVAHGGVIRALDRVTAAPEESIPNLAGRWYGFNGNQLIAGERVEFVPEGVDLGIE